MESQPIIQMDAITKLYPGGALANDNVSLTVREGEIHAVIGENGAGKTTLMNVLYGRTQPDSGRIRINGMETRISDPSEAIGYGLGFVTQHTTLIPAFTAMENVILGAEPTLGGVINPRAARLRIFDIAARLGISMDWNSAVSTLSVAARQKVEIIKSLYRGARILILDEPTATLAPQEADAFYATMRALSTSGATIIFITHKLQEVLAHSQHVTVLRGGRLVGERATEDITSEELLDMMLGGGYQHESHENPREHVVTFDAEFGESEVDGLGLHSAPALVISDLNVKSDRGGFAVNDVSIVVTPGEIVGVAGVDGSGQRELAEAIVGLRAPTSGSVLLRTENVTRMSVSERMRKGIAYIPEDRQRDGLIREFSLAENLLLGRQRRSENGGGRLLNWGTIRRNAEAVIAKRSIAASGADTPAGALSGGNQQKVVIARALADDPRVLVAMQPTRGLDVEATRQVYAAIREAQARGMAVLLFSINIDEILELSDRVAVMYNGGLATIMRSEDATPEAIGAYMVGVEAA